MTKAKKPKKQTKRKLPSRFVWYEKDIEIIQPKNAEESNEKSQK